MSTRSLPLEIEDYVPLVLWDRETEENIEFKILEDLIYEVSNDVMSLVIINSHEIISRKIYSRIILVI